MLEPIERRSLATEVFEQLRDHIVDGAITPGDALPSEAVIAERLGVDGESVHEALERLEQAGLISFEQGGATCVRDFRRTAGLESLGPMIVRRDGTIDTRVARGVLELRSELAPVIARLATRRAGDHASDAVLEAARTMEACRGDIPSLQRAALAFWASLVEATDNPALQLAFNSLEQTYAGVLEHFTHVLADEVGAVDDYIALARAVVGGREEQAEKYASEIVGRGARTIEDLLLALEEIQTR